MSDTSLECLSPIVIVGGTGNMGAFFHRMFLSRGVAVEIVEKETPHDQQQSALARAKAVLVSVPISKTIEVIRGILPFLPPDALLADVTSVKEEPVAAMSAHPGEVMGLHPMFGPTDRGIRGQTVVVCKHRDGERAETLRRFMEIEGARLHYLTPEQHDQLMAVVQGMNHFNAIVFAHALRSLQIDVDDTISVASPVYLLRMQLMGRILAQDPQLYADILLSNRHVAPALKELLSSSEKFSQVIGAGNYEGCVDFFKEAASALGSYGETALRESDELLAFATGLRKPS